MKKQYLLSMLLGGALLTACSVEDDLNVALDTQKANPSAPVFTVSVDNGDDLTRAEWLDQFTENNRALKLIFEDNDKLSLYHGMEEKTLGADWQHAVYQGKFDEANNKLNFFTQAMVQPGNAILVYPADLEFENGYNLGSGKSTMVPRFRIPLVQSVTTKDSTAYMSEVIKIDEPNEPSGTAKGAEPGYNKQDTYDIVLRRAAGTLVLNMDVHGSIKDEEPEGLTESIRVDSVRLEDKIATFTNSIAVKGTGTAPVQQNSHQCWISQSSLDQASANAYTKIVTEDREVVEIAGKEYTVATFTLLPVSQTIADAKTTDVAVTTAANSPKVPAYTGTQGSITVKTNYGKVELTTTDANARNLANAANADRVWTTNGGYKLTTKAGLDYVYNYIWTKTDSRNPQFYKDADNTEMIGAAVKATLDVDLAKLDMDGLHVRNEEHLMNALRIYEVVYKNKKNVDVNIILDGEKSGDNQGKFVMSSSTWNKVKGYAGKKLHFSPCQEENKCKAVVLKDDESLAVTEIPSIEFKNTTNGAPTFTLDVELDGDWSYADVVDDKTIEEEVEVKSLTGVTNLVVIKGSKLKLENYIAAANDNLNIKVEEGGEATVSGDVVLQVQMENRGIMTIPGQLDRLAVDAGAKFVNKEAETVKLNYSESECGYIKNGGTLAIIDGTNGVIENYGVIKLENGKARTLISKNSDENAKISGEFGEDNRFGTIILAEKTGGNNNTTVLNDKAQGFIKLTSTNAAGDFGSIANYYVLDGAYSKFNYAKDAMEKLLYLEVQSSNEVEIIAAKEDDMKLSGLFVDATYSINIPQTSQVSINNEDGNVYVKGTIVRSGTFTYVKGTNAEDESTQLKGYFGGEYNDYKKIFSFGVNSSN